jgi:hypothetical protein
VPRSPSQCAAVPNALSPSRRYPSLPSRCPQFAFLSFWLWFQRRRSRLGIQPLLAAVTWDGAAMSGASATFEADLIPGARHALKNERKPPCRPPTMGDSLARVPVVDVRGTVTCDLFPLFDVDARRFGFVTPPRAVLAGCRLAPMQVQGVPSSGRLQYLSRQVSGGAHPSSQGSS